MTKSCEYCKESFEAKKEKAKYCSDSCRNMAYQKRVRTGQTDGALSMKAKIDIIFNKVQELSLPVLKDSPKVSAVGTVFQNQPETKQDFAQRKEFEYYLSKIRNLEEQQECLDFVAEIEVAPLLNARERMILKERLKAKFVN